MGCRNSYYQPELIQIVIHAVFLIKSHGEATKKLFFISRVDQDTRNKSLSEVGVAGVPRRKSASDLVQVR